ncbi:MAG TPA: lantibiotic dehydratase [Gammaproteobacteria bacterium]|nr:lantibiotic dehydratase [Gammaproteobacteria bacterium]
MPTAPFIARLETALGRPLPLADGWSLWRVYAVRGAGFPLDLLDRFIDEELETNLVQVIAAQRRCDTAKSALHALLRARLPDDAARPGRPWHRALQAVQKRRAQVTVPADDLEADERAACYAQAAADYAAASARYRAAYARADLAFTAVASELAADVDFRAAVAWQNETALAQLTRHFASAQTPRDDGTSRQYRRLVASYLQRYCAKNEQIGFFGPCGWGLVDGARASLLAAPAPVRRLQVYFEYWAIDALADRVARLAPATLAPRLSPDVRLDARGLVLPDAVLPLDAAQREFLAALDGSLSVAALIESHAGRAGTGLGDAAAMHALLARLAETGVIDWRLPLPVTPEVSCAFDACVARASGIEDFAAAWRALDAERAALEDAPRAETPARIARFNACFEALAGIGARRLAGRAYAGRTPLYADAVREMELVLPDAVFTALAPALVPLLASAQWYTQQLLTQYLAYVTGVWRDVAGGAEISLAALWQVLQADTETALAIGADVVEQLQERWRSVLDVDEELKRQEFDVETVAARAREAFALAAAPWAGARFQAPDLLIAAADLDAVERGEWQAVLGEIHPCTNLMIQTVTGKLCPVREAALAATARVQTEPELLPAIAREARGQRTAYSLELDHDYTIEYGANRAARRDARVLRIADLLVRDAGGGPVLALRDGSRCWPLAQFFGPQLRSIGISRFKPFTVDAHLPRLTLGRLVLQRESWCVPRAALAFVSLRDRAERWLALRDWAQTLGLPRHCFYRVPGELKPWYLDLASPVYCDLFADVARRLDDGALTIGEMLPGPDQCWLRDGRGRRYTAELRMAAFTAP